MFLDGGLPLSVEKPLSYLCDVSQAFIENMEQVGNKVGNITEMEASMRVFLIVLEAIKPLDVLLKLQPELHKHPRFTDFFFVTTNSNNPLLLVEVKNISINTTMAQTECVAQVLREVHILLCEDCTVDEIPFILTNSHVWSFGYAKRKENMITVKSVFQKLIQPNEDYRTIVTHIRDILSDRSY